MNFKTIGTGILLALVLTATTVVGAEETPKAKVPTSTANINISPNRLDLMIRHLTSDELFVEANGWLNALKDSARKEYEAKLFIDEKNDEIVALKALESDQTTAEMNAQTQQKVSKANEEKDALLKALTNLNAEKKSMVARLDTVLKNINKKIGLDDKGKESEKVLPYRRYIDTVSGVNLEVRDAKSAWNTLSRWMASEDGGVHWLMKLATFSAILFAAMFISKLLSKGVGRALEHMPSNSKLLNDFIANIIHKVVMLVGLLVALSALDVNVAPILAMVGAAGFVVAFALQGTLSNFASGIMIMLYRPYDIGDIVDVAGITGRVELMTLVSTNIVTADNKHMVVPNNSIWGNIITNITHSDTPSS